jgi:dephospho-CoA kinase
VILFIIVGMPASGKNTARLYAEAHGIPYFATGDLIREEVVRQGLDPNPDTMARISNTLRGNDGMGVTRGALASALETGASAVFLEGMRSVPEIDLIRQEAAAIVIAFLAPRGTRLERIVSRGRADDSPEDFEARDRREIAYGTAVVIALADEYVLNTGSLDDAFYALDCIVHKYHETENQWIETRE